VARGTSEDALKRLPEFLLMPSTSRRYWLLKSEPDCYSIDDLERDGTTHWSGVRNYQARNFMRDEMKPGDGVIFYHSSAEPPGVAGFAEIAREGYADHTALDPDDDHFDPKATPENPIWMMVDVKFVRKLPATIPLAKLKETPGLEAMEVTKRGSRLSVQRVSREEFEIVSKLG
jgi:predicted RNA-binding protein with PUA-like domain